MSKLKKQILNIISWIALAIGIIMVLWRIFGNSPTDLAVIAPFIVFAIMKIGANSGAIKDVGHQVKILSMNTKFAFDKVRRDIHRIETKIDKLGRKK